MPQHLDGLDQLHDGESREYTLKINHTDVALFIVRHGGQYYAYENHCPHTGISLNWQPGQFLDISNQHIQCSTHGALFRIDNGLCEWGPCLGKSLMPVNITCKDGKYFIASTPA